MKLSQKMGVFIVRIKFRMLALVSKKWAAQKAIRLFCTPRLPVNPHLPSLFIESEKLQFGLNGIVVHGYRWNHPANRRVLILHGFDSSVTNFEPYIRPLVSKGYEVLAFDAPAHGKSGGDMITVPVYEDMIRAICEQFGPVQSFLAHSMGGLALALAMENIRHDEQSRLAFIAPATESSRAFDNLFAFLRLKDPGIRELFNKKLVEMSGRPLSWFSMTRALQQIKAGILWIHDEDDRVTPLSDTFAIRQQNYPGLKFVITRGLGHRRIYRDQQVINSVIDFL